MADRKGVDVAEVSEMAVAYPTDIPALYDVVMPDGAVVTDVTIGQLRTMAFHGYPIRRAAVDDASA